MKSTRTTLNYLVIAIMVFMIGATAAFIYGSVLLKNRIVFRIVAQTELVSELITGSAIELMGDGHGPERYSKIMDYGSVIGVDDIGIYTTAGREGFGGARGTEDGAPAKRPRSIGGHEREAFLRAVSTMNSTGFFNRAANTYSRYAPLRSEGACLGCHTKPGELLGVLNVRISTKRDFELLTYVRKLIWMLGLIVALPVISLVIAGAIIRDKNRIYGELKESSRTLKATYDEHEGTKYYLQMILDNSKVVIITTDMGGQIVEFNKEAETLLEYTKAEVVGKDVLMLYDNPRHRIEIQDSAGGSHGGVWEARNREVVFKSKSGKLFHMTLTLSSMVSDKGELIGTVGIAKDISEQRMLHFKLMQSEKLAGIGTLATGIAHEINNPLAGILGMAEAIRDEDDIGLIKSHTNDIIRYTVGAGDIVKELSAYSRSAQSAGSSTVDLSEVIESSLKMAGHSASFGAIEVDTELEKSCVVRANYGELQQVFVNLIINAVHAMKDGGKLTVRCVREGDFVVADVADTGHGISTESMSQVFDPFFTTKPAGVGTGLGLYLVYRIITKHNGSIDVESKKGEGAKFIVRFPVAVEQGLV